MIKYHTCHRPLIGRVLTWIVALNVIVMQCIPAFVPSLLAAETEEAEPEPIQAGTLSLGAHWSDSEFEGMGDVLVPVWYDDEYGLIFLNPRTSFTDNDEEEANIGIGWRKMISVKDIPFIVGLNAYYDSRWTQFDNRFDQLGLGLEILSEWVDVRANYYRPNDDQELADRWTTQETSTSKSSSSSTEIADSGPVVPEGNQFVQDVTYETTYTTVYRTTTTTYLWERFEAALEGYDAEIGVKLPYIDDMAETRVFVGYQDFDNPFGGDLNGAMARVEVRAMPGLTFDAKWFDNEELNGSDYSVGARLHVPFDIANIAQGKNPFEGAGDNFKTAQERKLADRMFEMVIRDVKVRTQVSEAVENITERTSQTSTSKSTTTEREEIEEVILDNVTFVDQDNMGDPEMNGSYEHPWDVIQDGVDNANSPVYVDYSDYGPYYENVVIPGGVQVYGSGTSIEGYDGKRYASTQHPVVIGDGYSPTFTIMGDNVTVSGFRISNPAYCGGSYMVTSPNMSWMTYDATTAGILSENNSRIIIRDNIFEDNLTYGAVVVDTLTSPTDKFVADIIGNYFGGYGSYSGFSGSDGATYHGLVVDTIGASGTFDVLMKNNVFNNNGQNGAYVVAGDYDKAFLSIVGGEARYNGWNGLGISVEDIDQVAEVLVKGVDASYNADHGIEVEEVSGDGRISSWFQMVDANYNGNNGLYFGWSGGAYSLGGQDAYVELSDITAQYNGYDYNYDGIRFGEYTARSEGGNATFVMRDVNASYNAGYGFYAEYGAYAEDGNALSDFRWVTADGNGYGGLWFSSTGAEADDSGNARLVMRDFSASYNGGNGVYFGLNGVYAEEGNATLYIGDGMANMNAGDGIHFGADYDDPLCAAKTGYGGGDATAVFDNIVANDNYGTYRFGEKYGSYGYYFFGGYGIYSEDSGAATYSGDALLVMTDITASYNLYGGIYMGEYGAVTMYDGDATVLMTDVKANYNGGVASGIHFDDATARTGVYSYYGYGYSYGGDATVMMEGITASYNWGDGMHFGWEGGAVAENGDAWFQMSDAYALYNGTHGITFGGPGAVAYGGDADFRFSDVTADFNGYGSFYGYGYGNGINFGSDDTMALAYDGDAKAVLTGIQANFNYGYGIYNSGSGAAAYGGDAAFLMQDGQASYNGRGGIYFGGYGAIALAGDASFTMNNVDASYNGGFSTGIHIDEDAARSGIGLYGKQLPLEAFVPHDATAIFSGVTANYNWGTGIYIGENGAFADYGSATLKLLDVMASYNYGDLTGIHIGDNGAQSYLGNAYTLFNGVTASYNNGDGIYFGSDGTRAVDGNATLAMLNTEANFNGGFDTGIHISGSGADAFNGDASTMFDGVTASYNFGHGIYMGYYGAVASFGDASFLMNNVTANYNDGILNSGIHIEYTAAHVASGLQQTGQKTLNGVIPLDDGPHDATAIFSGVTANYNLGTGIYMGWDGASTDYGDATFLMTDTEANYNHAPFSGIHIGGAAASGGKGIGDAYALFDGVTANYNDGDGIYIGWSGTVAGEGDATLIMRDVDASYNSSFTSGIHIERNGAEAYMGDANVTFDRVTASYNNGSGVYVGHYGAAAYQGDARFAMRDVEANYNNGDGIDIRGAAAFTTAGYAYAIFNGVESSYNVGDGIHIWGSGAYVAGAKNSGDAFFRMSDIIANNNAGSGMYLGGGAAVSIKDDAHATLVNITANGNLEYGLFSGSDMVYGQDDAIFSMRDSATSINGNGWGGIYVTGAGARAMDGLAQTAFRYVTASYNGGDNIYFSNGAAVSSGDEALATFNNVVASYGSGTGLNGASAMNYGAGPASVSINDSVFEYNSNDGVNTMIGGGAGVGLLTVRDTVLAGNSANGISIGGFACGGTISADLGAAGDAGNNSIFGNGAFGVGSFGNGSTTVEGNYWDGAAPVGAGAPTADYQTPGVADPGANWLTTDPNP